MFSPDWKQCFMQVLPASLNAEATSFSGPGLQNAVAGSPVYLTVAPRDSYGNVCNKGPVDLQASAMLLPADAVLPNLRATLPVNIANNLDGSFLLSVTSEQVEFLSQTDDWECHSPAYFRCLANVLQPHLKQSRWHSAECCSSLGQLYF